MNTQVGKIADMLSATEDEKTPLQKEMDYVSKILGIAVCVIAVVVLVALAVLEGFNDVHDVIDSLLLAVSAGCGRRAGRLGRHPDRGAGAWCAAYGRAQRHRQETAFGGRPRAPLP